MLSLLSYFGFCCIKNRKYKRFYTREEIQTIMYEKPDKPGLRKRSKSL